MGKPTTATPKVRVPTDGQKEACKTYIDQTKLLVTLASAFLFAPAALFSLLKDHPHIDAWFGRGFIACEAMFVLSVLCGYVTLGTVSGSQEDGTYDVYRPATRFYSLAQFVLYLIGISVFVGLAIRFFGI
jgi:hypothetical protein